MRREAEALIFTAHARCWNQLLIACYRWWIEKKKKWGRVYLRTALSNSQLENLKLFRGILSPLESEDKKKIQFSFFLERVNVWTGRICIMIKHRRRDQKETRNSNRLCDDKENVLYNRSPLLNNRLENVWMCFSMEIVFPTSASLLLRV